MCVWTHLPGLAIHVSVCVCVCVWTHLPGLAARVCVAHLPGLAAVEPQPRCGTAAAVLELELAGSHTPAGEEGSHQAAVAAGHRGCIQVVAGKPFFEWMITPGTETGECWCRVTRNK